MRYWLSHLPLEVWVDCYRYPWISREELGRIVDRFGNRKYVEYLQFYLHDWGKRQLNELYFDENGLCKLIDREPYLLQMDFPQTPMPGNVKSFQRITFFHFNMQTIAFLRQLGPILTDVNLTLHDLPKNMDNLHIILDNMLPLLNNIHSLSFNVRALSTVQQCFGNEKLTAIKVLSIYAGDGALDETVVQATANFLMNWLASPAKDHNGPRAFDMTLHNIGFCEQISASIREEFLMAKTPCTFALRLLIYGTWEFAEFQHKNDIGEELYGIKNGNFFRIIRLRANCDKELDEWVEENVGNNRAQIHIINPTIGSIDAIMDGPEKKDEEEAQKPFAFSFCPLM